MLLHSDRFKSTDQCDLSLSEIVGRHDDGLRE